MFIEKTILFTAIVLIIVGPASVLGYLIVTVWKKLRRNPASATQISVGIIFLMLLVLGLSIVTILILFQLFNKRF